MKKKNTKIYICTVGTGTAGKNSFMASGILAGITKATADHAFLIPSHSKHV